MTDKNWSQIGDEIEDMVRKALESRDFGKLSQDLSRTVGEAMENVGKSVQDAVNKANDKTREATERYSDRADKTADAHSGKVHGPSRLQRYRRRKRNVFQRADFL